MPSTNSTRGSPAAGDKRFPPVAANIRGWLLARRRADRRSDRAAPAGGGRRPGPTFQEAHYAALLDLADCHLAGRRSATTRQPCSTGPRTSPAGPGRCRGGTATATALSTPASASLGGDHAQAADDARAVASRGRRTRRSALRAPSSAHRATIDARAGRRPTRKPSATLVERFLPHVRARRLA